jgi:hypothetical protein
MAQSMRVTSFQICFIQYYTMFERPLRDAPQRFTTSKHAHRDQIISVKNYIRYAKRKIGSTNRPLIEEGA